MKFIPILLICLMLGGMCSVASAENDTITLYDEGNKKNVIKYINAANMGDVFAMLDLATAIALPTAGIILALTIIIAQVMGKPEWYKKAVSALFVIMAVCAFVQVFFGWISGLTPSIQVIKF